MAIEKLNRVLVTGGGTYLGINIASALLAEGAEVTLILREEDVEKLGPLAARVRWHIADVWDTASLKGRARGHGAVIHTVGSMVEEPTQGLTYQRLNVVSARNTANMCVMDGVPHLVLMSTVAAPWVNSKYVKAKREAETYMLRLGLKTSIIRAPLTYVRGTKRPFFYRLMTLLGSLPPLAWTPMNRIAPMPLDILARGVARIALHPASDSRVYHRHELRRLNSRDELRGRIDAMRDFERPQTAAHNLPFEMLDEETPFAWIPPNRSNEE